MNPRTRSTSELPRTYDRAALARFEVFLFAAIATVLITRTYLAATGYPQIGGGGFHVAHVLWGGLLMAVAIVATVVTDGSRTLDRAALVGGVGFGLFIDEIGKFVTADVDYFYQPAIAIMYVVFVLFYLAVRELVTRRGLRDRHRLAIGARALSDLALGQLDEIRYRHTVHVLDGIEDRSLATLVESIKAGLRSQPPQSGRVESKITHGREVLVRRIESFLQHRVVRRLVLAFFVLQALVSIAAVADALFSENGVQADGVSDLVVQISGAASGLLVIVGVWFLSVGPYLRALRLLQASMIVSLLVTQVFLFTQNELGALFGFAVSLFMLATLRVAIRSDLSSRHPLRPAQSPSAPPL